MRAKRLPRRQAATGLERAGDEAVDLPLQDRQRQGAVGQHGVVKSPHVKIRSQGVFGPPAQFLDLQFTELVAQGLARTHAHREVQG